ncbi:MAG: hypothetical protein ABSG04_12550 [Verrucomicrobiota bacterium]
MNTESTSRKNGNLLTVLAVAGAFLLMAWLVWLMRAYTQAHSLAQARAVERLKIKADFDAANAPLLNGYDWADKDKGFVRVPVARAKELILQEWQDPAAGRSNLLQRAAKEFAPVAAAKNPYE